MHVYPTDAASSNSVTASGTDGILLWGAQLETGVATDYIATTSAAVTVGPVANVPRLDYLDSSSPRLLLEPQRTNLATYSEDITQTGSAKWVQYGGVTVTANNATSPDGYVSADKMDSTGGVYIDKTFTAGTAYAISVFIKKDTATLFRIEYVDQTSPFRGGTITYTFATGAIAVAQSENTSVSGEAVDYGNGWIRLIMKMTANAAANYSYQQFDFDGGEGWVWGFQMEEGAYATSYIPTLGAAVTRGADSASKTSASALIGQDEGVVFVDFEVTDPADFQPINIYNNNKAADTISTMSIQFNVDTVVANFSLGNGTFDAISLTGGGYGLNQRLKVAFKYKSGQLALYVNGVQKDTDTATYTAIGTKSEIFLGDTTVYFAYKGGFKLYEYLQFPASLTNAQLAALTA